MYTLTDKSQVQASAIKSGRHKLAPGDQEVLDWISGQFGVKALDFSCETRRTTEHPQQLVHVILEGPDEVKKMQADRTGCLSIADRFLGYFKSASPLDPLKRDVLTIETLSTSDIIVTYRPFKEPSRGVWEEIFADEKRAVLKTYQDAWVLSQTVVFYFTDAQIKENDANGTSAQITQALHSVERMFGLVKLSEYRFDSKETFDRDYQSNWYYYWK